MSNTLLTHFQIFLIGFSFGIAGPCFLLCTPILVTYIAGNRKKFTDALSDIFIFLSGRLLSYLILGYLAGISGALLRQFISSNVASLFKPLGGFVSVVLGALVLINRGPSACKCPPSAYDKIYNFGGLFVLGFMLGITPCGPLAALLFEIVMISKSALDGMFYALSFGLGTFISGFIVVGFIAGVLTQLPVRLLKSERANLIFRVICATLLILFGISLILTRYPFGGYNKWTAPL